MKARHTLHPGLQDIVASEVIDKTSAVPLHYQLERFLRVGIESGRFPPLHSLPTEQDLQEFFDLSRTPIRQAIQHLVVEGLVKRNRSQGTIVISPPFDENLSSLSSFTEEVLHKGRIPHTRLLDFVLEAATEEDQQHLRVGADTRVFHVCRLRLIDEEPVGLVISHLPEAVVPDLRTDMFLAHGAGQSLYSILETTYHFKLTQAREIISAVNLSEEEAVLLALPSQHAILQRDRITFDQQQRPVAWERGLYHARYHVEWSGRGIQSFERALTTAAPDK